MEIQMENQMYLPGFEPGYKLGKRHCLNCDSLQERIIKKKVDGTFGLKLYCCNCGEEYTWF